MRCFIFLLSVVRECSSSLYDKPVPEVIEHFGYPSQTHSVFTTDGFNLILHRIPYSKQCKVKGNCTPVLLAHGLFQSSLCWLYQGPEKSLGFLLADNGFDVWLSNSRGNCYSFGHKYLNRNQPQYWDFSFHEQGVYDITASVDYIVKATNRTEVLFIGYSESSSAGVVNAIKCPQTKIKAYFLIAPIVHLTKCPSPLRVLFPAGPVLTLLTQTLGHFEISLSYNQPPLKLVEKIICDVLPEVCYAPYGVCGFDPLHINLTAAAVQLVHMCGISTKQLIHYIQGFYLDFSEYSYGILDNCKKYGISSPPRYNVEVIKKPVYIYHARNDLCGDLMDVQTLAKQLGKNLIQDYLVDDPNFCHLSFVINERVKDLVYDVLISHLREASGCM